MQNHSFDKRGLSILAIGHILNDMNQGAIPALIPFIVASLGLNYLGASGITLAATVLSSFIQPLLGLYSDRHPLPWLIPLGITLSGLGLAASGLMPSYWLVILAVLIAGIGSASFHPEGYRFANYFAGGNVATAMSVFTVSGNVGFALGPLVVSLLLVRFGSSGTWPMILPAGLIALVILSQLPRMNSLRQERQAAPEAQEQTNWRAFYQLLVVIVFRSMSYYCIVTFAPLFLVKMRGVATAQASSMLTVMSLAGILGALSGGTIAKALGYKRALSILAASITIMILLFVNLVGIPQIAVIAAGSFFISASFTISVVLAQMYGSGNLGLASGLTTGFAIGLGGLGAPIMGLVADHYGLTITLYLVALLPLVSAGLVLNLPELPKNLTSKP